MDDVMFPVGDAVCYILLRESTTLTPDACKRLRLCSEFSREGYTGDSEAPTHHPQSSAACHRPLDRSRQLSHPGAGLPSRRFPGKSHLSTPLHDLSACPRLRRGP